MKFTPRLVLFAVLVLVTAVGCKKSHDHDHLDVAGFQIMLDNQVVASQSGTTVTGGIVVSPGVTTGPFTVTFLDPEGRALIITDADMRLSLDTSNSSVFTTEVNGYSFNVVSPSQGTANLTVSLMHGSHKDFESRPVQVSSVNTLRTIR